MRDIEKRAGVTRTQPSPFPDAVFDAAKEARSRAYAPYSAFPVGAAVQTRDGRIFAGANMENAAYPLGQCAEANALGAMVSAAGGQHIVCAVVVGGRDDDPGDICAPCGGCRQKLREFAADETPVFICGTEGLRLAVTLGTLLPYSFGPHNLNHAPSRSEDR